MKTKSILQILKPGIPKRYLLFIAALVWTFAGGMLLFRGFSMLQLFPEMYWLKTAGSVIAGIFFYKLLFSKISLKHTLRIVGLKNDRPCVFSFFNWKSYCMMGGMISVGIILRITGIVSLKYLSPFYITMGTPLFLSAFRFYYFGINYQHAMKKYTYGK